MSDRIVRRTVRINDDAEFKTSECIVSRENLLRWRAIERAAVDLLMFLGEFTGPTMDAGVYIHTRSNAEASLFGDILVELKDALLIKNQST